MTFPWKDFPRTKLKGGIHMNPSPLNGKHILFLGSSVTYGSASGGISVVDFLAERNGFSFTKEAVSGTTLVDTDESSYISRLKKLGPSIPVDLLVCQLSTNDASQRKPLGKISSENALSSFDTKTVAGAIEYIIAYTKLTWHCPVVFYTSPRYEDPRYEAMTRLMDAIAEKWAVPLIDMWKDPAFPQITEDKRRIFMADPIHPTRAGYLNWWVPYWEGILFPLFPSEPK